MEKGDWYMTRKRYIKLVMSLLYGRNQAVEQAWYINSLMKTDKRVTYQDAWDMLDEYDDHYYKVMMNKKNKEKL